MVIRRQFKFWKYLSRYQFERIPIRRRYETKDVSFYARPVPVNDLQQFQSPESRVRVRTAESRESSMFQCTEPERQSPETRVQRMICVKFQRTEWSAEWVRQALSQQPWWFFVKAPMIWWLVTYRWFHQCHGARASIEGGFFESKKAT